MTERDSVTAYNLRIGWNSRRWVDVGPKGGRYEVPWRRAMRGRPARRLDVGNSRPNRRRPPERRFPVAIFIYTFIQLSDSSYFYISRPMNWWRNNFMLYPPRLDGGADRGGVRRVIDKPRSQITGRFSSFYRWLDQRNGHHRLALLIFLIVPPAVSTDWAKWTNFWLFFFYRWWWLNRSANWRCEILLGWWVVIVVVSFRCSSQSIGICCHYDWTQIRQWLRPDGNLLLRRAIAAGRRRT